MADHPATAWRRLAERVAFHMGALAHDLAMLEAGDSGEETTPFGPFAQVPVVTRRPGHPGGRIVPGAGAPLVATDCSGGPSGGMCGCDDADDGPPKVCLSRECDC